MMEKAQRHLEAGELEEAETLFRAAIDENPDDAGALFLLAQVRQQRGDPDEALSLLRRVELLEPRNPQVFHARGVLHLNRKEMEEARRAFRQALALEPGHTASQNAMAFLELAAGRFDAARHAAEQVLSDAPNDVQALIYKGTALLELNKLEDARSCLTEALNLEPEALDAHAQLGRAFLKMNNPGFAAQCFENALQLAPGSVDLLEYLGRAQLAMGETIPAIKPLREAVSRGRANPALFRDLATCETAAGNPDQAEGLLAAALQMTAKEGPPPEELVLPLAELLIARGATDGAMAALGTQVQAGRESEMLDVLISRARLSSGDTAAAVSAIEERARADHASVLARLTHAQALEADGQETAAAALLEVLLAEDPPATDVLLYRARKWFDAGDPAAIDAFQDIVNRKGLSSRRLFEVRRLLADALHRAGRYPEAAGQYTALATHRAEILTIDQDFDGSGVDATSAMDAAVTAEWPRKLPDDGRPNPVFVIGWPGSGRERVLPALGAHSGLLMLKDPASKQAGRRAHIDRPRGAGALQGLDEAQVLLRRRRYWKCLERLGVDRSGPAVLDVMWLTAESLPTVARLFPGSRVLVVVRDPKDMAVAWMMSGYRDLDGMSQGYERQLELLERCRDSLPLEFVGVDYDVVEAEPARSLEEIQQVLGLKPEAAVVERFRTSALPVPVEKGVHERYPAEESGGESAPGSGAVH